MEQVYLKLVITIHAVHELVVTIEGTLSSSTKCVGPASKHVIVIMLQWTSN